MLGQHQSPRFVKAHALLVLERAHGVIWKEKVTDFEYHGGHERTAKPAVGIHALSEKQQAIVPIAAFTANGDLESLKTAVRSGLDAGLTINEIKELQMYLYA
jgi:4-carboxymuconolactone decarboxylase